jgi:hypothetical protein
MKEFLKKSLKVVGKIFKWILIILLFVFLLIFIVWKVPAVHDYAVEKGTSFFNEKTGGNLSIGEVDLRLPFFIGLEDISLDDPQGDRLAFIDDLEIFPGWRMLFAKTIRIDEINLSGVEGKIYVNKNGSFNFDFITEGFTDSTATDTAATDTTSGGWGFSLGDLNLKAIDFIYADRSTGDSIDLDVGLFELDMDELDLENQAYLAESITIENTNVFAQISASESSESSGETVLPELGLEVLEVSNTIIALKMGTEDPYNLSLGELYLNTEEINLNENRYLVEELSLSDSRFLIPLPAESTEAATQTESSSDTENTNFFPDLRVALAELILEGIEVKAFTGRDTLHHLRDLKLLAEDLEMGSEGFAANMESLTGAYNEFTDLKEFSGEFAFRPAEAKAADVFLRYGESRINLNALLSYNSVEELINANRFSDLDASISDTRIARSDIERIYQAMEMDTLPLPAADIFLSLEANGNQEAVDLEKLFLETGQSQIRLKANLIAGRDSLWPGDLTLNQFKVDVKKKDLQPFLAYAGTDPAQIPAYLKANFQGLYHSDRAKMNGEINTAFGSIALDAKGDGWAAAKQGLTVNIGSEQLRIGEYLNMPQALIADFSLFATSQDITDSVPRICTELVVDTLNYGGYRYADLLLDAEVTTKDALFAFSIEDTFVTADIGGYIDYADDLYASVTGQIDGVDLQGLDYAKKDIRGTLDFQAQYKQDSAITDAYASINDILFVKEGERYSFQPITASFYTCPDSTAAHVTAGFLQLNSVSNRGIDSLTSAIAEVVARGQNRSVMDTSAYWRADLKTDNLDEIGELFLPALTEFKPSSAKIDFSAKNNTLMAEALFPGITYGSISLDSLTINSNDTDSGTVRQIHIDRVAFDTLALRSLDLSAERTGKGADLLLTINPDTASNYYRIGAVLKADSIYLRNGYTLQFNDTLVLNGKKWNYDEQCCIRSTDDGLNLEAFRLFRNEQSIRLEKSGDSSPLVLEAENFPIRSIVGMFNTETDLLSGALFGELSLNNDGSFEGDGYINDWKVSGADFGKLTWEASKQESAFRTKIHNQGDQVDFVIEGDIIPRNDTISELDLTFQLNRFELKTLENLLNNSISEAGGSLEGEIAIGGTTLNPELDGSIGFRDVALQPKVSRAKYFIKNDELVIKPGELRLNNFTLQDENNSNLTLDGTIKHDNFTNPKMDMSIEGEDFMLVDLAESADLGIYGKLVADLDLKIEGDMMAPTVTADIRINKPTDISYVVSTSVDREAFEESLVVWTNFEEDPEYEILTREKKETEETGNFLLNNPKVKGTLNIDESAVFQVMIDTTTGDYLQIRGNSKLSIDYDRSGTLRFNGVYEVADGFYQLSFYNVVKKRFDFKKGSKLVWNGEPTNATIDFTAIYQQRTSIANLMLTDPNATYETAYNQQLPFLVLLNINGMLLEPEISFGIELAEEAQGALNGSVQARLNDLESNESNLNKQVFALLVLNSFLPQDGGSSNNNLVANQARNSASQILTNQLNTLSDKYVKGIDINFDLNSYGGSAGEGNTDLSVNVAKSFADNRIIVKVGSTIALEQDNARTAQSQQVLTNVEVEYLITPDGRYRLIAFSKTDLEDIVIGRITRSGGGFVFQKDFDRFRYLFDPAKTEEEQKKQESGDENSEKESGETVEQEEVK